MRNSRFEAFLPFKRFTMTNTVVLHDATAAEQQYGVRPFRVEMVPIFECA